MTYTEMMNTWRAARQAHRVEMRGLAAALILSVIMWALLIAAGISVFS